MAIKEYIADYEPINFALSTEAPGKREKAKEVMVESEEESKMQPDPQPLLNAAAIRFKPIGLYDAPDPTPFEPLVGPHQGRWACVFMFYRTRPMFEHLCELDERSFLHKRFWRNLKKVRER
jgi:hypothetical protein